jgi:hypothetical protein
MTALAVFHALMAMTTIRERPWLGEGRSLRGVANDGKKKRRGFYEACSSQALIGEWLIAHTSSVRSDQCLGSLR